MSEDNSPLEPNPPFRKTAFPKRKRIRSGVEFDAPSRSHRDHSDSPRRRALSAELLSDTSTQPKVDAPFEKVIEQAAIETSALPQVEKDLTADKTKSVIDTKTWKPLSKSSAIQVEPEIEEPAVTADSGLAKTPEPDTAENKVTEKKPQSPKDEVSDVESVFLRVNSRHPQRDEKPKPGKSEKRMGASEKKKPTTKKERPAPKKRKSPLKRKLITFVVLAAMLLAVGGIGTWAVSQFTGITIFAETDYPGPGGDPVDVVIPEGATGTAIAKLLVDNGVIKTADVFIEAWNKNPQSQSIRPGTYRLKTKIPAKDALSALLNPNNRISNGVEIRSGMPIWQVKQQLIEHGKFTEQQVDAALKDTKALGIPASANGYAEGWLAPGSYNVKPGDNLVEILKKMVQGTKDMMKDLNIPEDQQEAALIKASIAEKEVGSTKYYGKVVTVINNRLKDGNETAGFLGMDTTIMYGLHKDHGELTRSELQKDTPYNSRLHKGLPPSPICAVGEEALKAAINPEPGNWLYFVTVNYDTGETLFSDNSVQFEKDRQLFVQYCHENPEKCK